MNYISLISLFLGIVCIIITMKYIENYDKLNKSIKILKNHSTNVIPDELIIIQDELDISQDEFLNLFKNDKKNIIQFLKSIKKKSSVKIQQETIEEANEEQEQKLANKNIVEEFNNNYYFDVNQRNLEPNIKLNNKDSKNKVIDKKTQLQTNNLKITQPYYLIDDKDFVTKNRCFSEYEGTNYIYKVIEKEFCKGKLIY